MNNDLTLVASTKKYIVPYGTCELNSEGYLNKINEKPEYNFLVNAGLYIFNPDILQLIPENQPYDITQLITSMVAKNKQVGVYPIDEDSWNDIGQWKQYEKVIKKMGNIKI